MGRRVVPEPEGLGNLKTLLELLTDKDAYAAQVNELTAIIADARKAAEELGVLGEIEAARARAVADRDAAAGELTRAQDTAKRILEGARVDLAAQRSDLAQARAQLDKERALHTDHVEDWKHDMASQVKAVMEREAHVSARASSLDIKAADLARQEQAMNARRDRLTQAAALVRE